MPSLSGYDHQVPNPAQPGKLYSLAMYQCEEGYKSESLSMFCSDGEWMGKQPQCNKVEEENEEYEDISDLQCSADQAAQCQHICILEHDGYAYCQCQEGFRIVH